MAALKLDLFIEQGATFVYKLTWKVGKPAVPVDLTGCTARAQFRSEQADPAVLLELTTENGGIILGGYPAGETPLITSEEGDTIISEDGDFVSQETEYAYDTGEITLKLSATQTGDIDWTSGVYDLEIEFPDGTVRRLTQGKVKVSLQVTR